MQQLVYEEGLRASGDSGIKLVRGHHTGTRPYFAENHIGASGAYAFHDHSQNMRTVGIGEIVVVLNGVEFRTRHLDYPLKKPHTTKNTYQLVQDIVFPDVPPSVLAKATVQEQVEEMQQYFLAFQNQTPDLRDYKPYFKPMLCYLEGAWTASNEEIDEPFESDRHEIDATTWWELTEKVRYTAYTGRKSNKENYSFHPMKIIRLTDENEPVFAQWNYRILCHQFEEDIPTKQLRIIDDLPTRMKMNRNTEKTLEEMAETRQARFTLSNFDESNVEDERQCQQCYLDSLMGQIPGMDNYGCDLSDDSFGIVAEPFGQEGETLNTCYYHRVYQSGQPGAMGLTKRSRGFNDQNVYMAQNSQEKIPGSSVTDCDNGCHDYFQRWSYAIPLEIIYMTPLYNWNPHQLPVHMWGDKVAFNAVVADGRNGGFTPETAYNGTRPNIFYITPKEFFEGAEEPDRDPADTSKGVVGVLDEEGVVREVAASGTRIFLPDIPGIGKIRLRYPIAPLHYDGNSIWKELQVMKDIVMNKCKYSDMSYETGCDGVA